MNNKPKLSQAQAIIIAAIITAIVSGYFVLKAAISPTELTIKATQNAEIKLTQAFILLSEPSATYTPIVTAILEATSTSSLQTS